jgi:hypothetical protein
MAKTRPGSGAADDTTDATAGGEGTATNDKPGNGDGNAPAGEGSDDPNAINPDTGRPNGDAEALVAARQNDETPEDPEHPDTNHGDNPEDPTSQPVGGTPASTAGMEGPLTVEDRIREGNRERDYANEQGFDTIHG